MIRGLMIMKGNLHELQGMLAGKISEQTASVIIALGNFIQSILSKGFNMKNIVDRMVEIRLAKQALKITTPLKEYDALEGLGVPEVINAMAEERTSTEVPTDFDTHVYDHINQIMENAYEQGEQQTL
jgi:hypothetical protein